MSSPVVGSARIEYTADLARFARESDIAIRATDKNMVRQFEQGLTRINASAGAGGRAAGNTFQQNVVNNVQNTSTRIVNIIRNPAAYSRAGAANADAFSRTIQARLEAAVRNLPKIKLDANSTPVDRELAQVRAKLAAASRGLQLGISTDLVNTRVTEMETRLRALAATTTDVRVRVNTAAALAEIEAFKAAMSGRAKKTGEDAGDKLADAFTRNMRTKLTAAFEALPKIELNANSSKVDKEVAKIRRQLEAADRAIKLGVSTDLVDARLAEIRRKLRVLSNDADIKVRVNARTALAELEAVRRAGGGLGNDNRRESIFTRLAAQARQASPAFDSVITKLGGVGGALSSLGGNSFVGVGVILAAVISLLSTIGPLAAAATGGLLGVVGVAGAAGLAVLGLQKQMAQQTGFGQQLSTQVKKIVQEVGGLGQVAADAVGPALLSVIQFARNAIPSFQGLVTLVGGRLGGAFRSLGGAVVGMLQKAAPLAVEVAGYIEDGAAALARWVASDSFDSFIAYARKELPVIIGYVVNFGKSMIDTFVALAPLGEKVLAVLDWIIRGTAGVAKEIAGILHFSGAGLLGGIFGDDDKKAESTAQGIDSVLSSYQNLGNSASSIAGQAAPLDNYRKILGDIAPALQAAAGNSGQFSVAVSGIVDELRSANPALSTFIDTASSFDPASAKLADTAKLLGDALTASRGFALDYATAMVGADSATVGLTKTLHDNLESVTKGGTLLGVSYLDASGKFVQAANQYTAGSSDIVGAFQSQVKAATDAASATYTQVLSSTGDNAKAGTQALAVYKGIRAQFLEQAKAAGYTAEQVKGLSDQYFAVPPSVDTFVDLLGKDQVGAAIQGLTAALTRLSDFIGAPTIGMNKNDFDRSKAIVDSDLDFFGNRKTLTSLDLSNGQFNQKAAQSNGVLDVLGAKTARPTVALNDQASGGINALIGRLGAIDREIVVTVRERREQGLAPVQGRQASNSAYGNIFSSVPAFAQGGFVEKEMSRIRSFAFGSENHVPQIALPGGTTRIWAEPETMGEAYIPFNPDRRTRAVEITSKVANKFGYDLTKRGDRAGVAVVSQGGSTGPALNIENMQVAQSAGEDGQTFASRVASELAWSMRGAGF